ncbi:MAG TPA: hypothetical protein VMF08_03420 [Candidatus Sulfotelmatobacter sp.]|nr:hypothetical protein [Candidatus Sulfotelmatobacter sp.]
MKKFEFDSILKKARIPEPPAEFWEDFPGQVARQLNRPPKSEPERLPRRNWFSWLAWGLGTAMCIVLAFIAGHWRGRMEASRPQDILANPKLVHETLAMFPNQVRAIVEDHSGLRLVLSDGGTLPPSPPLYVRICDGKECSSFVTFSGQEIQVAGRQMTVLADTHGGIILTGNDFVWASDQKIASVNGMYIEARNLGLAAL